MANSKLMILKTSAGSASKGPRARQRSKKVEEEPEVEEPQAQDDDQEAGDQQEQEEQEEVSEEDRIAKEEDELKAARKKELKGMYIDELKEAAASKGVEPCKKDEMIDAVLAAEAKERADGRAHKAKLRSVVMAKKDALEALPMPELRELSSSFGIKGQLTKQARVEHIMKLWQEEDGVDKAMAQLARSEREQELVAMDKLALRKLCETAGVNPLIQQVMVDRLVRFERASGNFARPSLSVELAEEQDEKPKKGKKVDMVDALLQSDARRKKEAEQKVHEEEAEAKKRKELAAMPLEELKKLLVQKGHAATGKKDDVVEALFRIALQEDAVAARKAKLRALPTDELKALVVGRGLSAGKKEDMIEALFEQEAKVVEEIKAYEVRIEEVLAKTKEELEGKSAQELKDMCAAKDLKLGIGKEMRLETLLEDARLNDSVHKSIAALVRDARAQELLAKEQGEVLALCELAGVDPLVKEVLVERLLAHEEELGCRVELEAEPKAKRSRKQ